jgi:hypothetical protein
MSPSTPTPMPPKWRAFCARCSTLDLPTGLGERRCLREPFALEESARSVNRLLRERNSALDCGRPLPLSSVPGQGTGAVAAFVTPLARLRRVGRPLADRQAGSSFAKRMECGGELDEPPLWFVHQTSGHTQQSGKGQEASHQPKPKGRQGSCRPGASGARLKTAIGRMRPPGQRRVSDSL